MVNRQLQRSHLVDARHLHPWRALRRPEVLPREPFLEIPQRAPVPSRPRAGEERNN